MRDRYNAKNEREKEKEHESEGVEIKQRRDRWWIDRR